MPNTSNPPGAISPDDRTQGLDRYAEVSLADDTVVIYDRENPQRWVQSGTAVRLVEVR